MALYDLQQQDVRPFKLSEEFLEPYKTRKPDFGFNGLGEVTYRRTYSRVMPDGKKEEWWQTIRRVIEGVYTMQKKWIISNNLGWDNLKAQKSAKEMYERMFSMKFLPAGRGLWAWGTPITEEKGLYLALNSCAMVTTETIREKLAEPFCFLMDASMLGVGVGFDTKGAGKLTINKPIDDVEIYQITDDREGWVISVEKLINSYFLPNQKTMEFDYSLIRPAGEPIKGFGGISSGSEALKQLHINLRTILDNRVGDKISSQDIVDMMNLIGTCVISGNVRRCLRKGTLVFTSEGAKPIENIVVGDTVFTSKGTTTVTEAVYQGKQELLRINTDAGFIDCTDKHRIAVLDTPQSYVWKHANEITLDDRLVFINTHDRSFGYKKLIPAKVLSIEPIGIDDTYDLSVLDKQEFVLGNGLLVHNTAEIAFGEVDDKEFLNLKNYDLHPERMDYGWTSNNSIFAQLGMSYDDIAERIKDNGEPGLEWLDNARAYSRMIDAPDYKDKKVVGANPCFIYGTPILTDKGYVEIGTLDGKKALLVDENGTIQNSQIFKSGNKETIKLSLSNNQEIICTPDHIFKSINGSVQAKDSKNIKLMPFLHYKNLNEKYVLYGFLQGDGVLGRLKSDRHHGIEAIIGKNDADIWKLVEQHKHTVVKRGAYIQDIKDELIALGFDSNKLPERVFPDSFDTWSYEDKAAFLRGCFSANGTVLSTGRICYKATSKSFIQKLQDILKNTFDIDSYITINKPTSVKFSNGTYILKESYDINIGRFEEKVKFYNKINFYQEYKRLILKSNLIMKAPYVRSIKPNGVVDVYDFTMENNHWGVVNGFIAHNCGEQSLENMETCLLVESFPNRNENLEDYKRTLKFAYLYAKTVTLAKTHWAETNRVMLRNRRIGLSMSGIAQFITDRGLHELKRWCEEGYKTIRYYDDVYSDWLAIPKSIKVTSVKPSGSVSLLAGATAGIHYPESNFYIRRIRLSKFSDLIEPLRKAGYKIEPAVGQEDSTVVAEFPVSLGKNMRTIKDISMWEQLSLGAFMQKYWSDNQVSQTVTFNPKTEGKDIAHALEYFQYQLKGVSFLPALEYESYPQMPYEAITEEEYNSMMEKITEIDFSGNVEDAIDEKFCNNDVCTIL